ncbi:MAG: pyridoxal-phosphate dependent enzyme [Paracoccaceae bacterium]
MTLIAQTAARAHAAHARIRGLIYETPLLPSQGIGARLSVDLHFKAENFQHTGSFKLRGATNKLSILGQGARAITASSGNHGIACSHSALRTGARLTVVLPETVLPAKLARIRSYGTDVIIHGADSGLAEAHAQQISRERGIAYISPYNDPDIIAGQGTAGVEMLAQHPGLDAVFISLGGGGLVSGIGSVLKAVNPAIQVYGVSATASAALAAALRSGAVHDVPHLDTLADGCAGGMDADSITLPVASAVIDQLIDCSEAEIVSALRAMAHEENQIVEGAAALALAGFLQIAGTFKGKSVAIVTCGANYDPAKIMPLLAVHP